MATVVNDAPAAQAPTVLVGPGRVRWGAFAVLLGLFGAVVTAKAIAVGEIAGAMIGLTACGAAFAVCARLAVTRRSLIVFDDYGFTDCRSGRAVPWDAVESMCARIQYGPFGSDHSLHLELGPEPGVPSEPGPVPPTTNGDREIAVRLGGLSLAPEQLIAAVELRSGLPVLRTRTSGLPVPRVRTIGLPALGRDRR
jgi:hypothetical protein